MLAKVSVVDSNGNILLDTFAAPTKPVVDYRTAVNGITPAHLIGAPTFAEVQAQVWPLFVGRKVIGHSVHYDLAALGMESLAEDRRIDTATLGEEYFGTTRTPSLKRLVASLLNVQIQGSEHSSVEDAMAALAVYKRLKGTRKRKGANSTGRHTVIRH